MNVGIVGIQGFGGTYLATIAKRPNDRVIALCDLDAEKVAVLADQYDVPHRTVDFQQFLAVPELEAVFIATPHFLHHPMVMAALAAGKHVFMFDARTSWRLQSDKSGGGIMIGRGSHLIDAVLYVLDFPEVRSIAATMHRHLTGGEVDDFATATLRLENDVLVNIQCSYVAHTSGYEGRVEYEIFGTAGGVAYLPAGDRNNALTAGRADMADGSWEDFADAVDESAIQRAAAVTIIDDFLTAAADERSPLVTGEQAAYVTRILEAAYVSDRSGQEVAIA